MTKDKQNRTREAFLLGEINEENMRQFSLRIRNLVSESPNEEITVYITSHGGSVSLALAFYDFANIIRARLTTIALGCADSAAIIILLTGKKRKAGKNTTFLIHHVRRSWRKETSFNPDNLRAESIDLEIKSEKMARLIAKETGQSLANVKAQIAKEISLVSEEALNFGLIDKII